MDNTNHWYYAKDEQTLGPVGIVGHAFKQCTNTTIHECVYVRFLNLHIVSIRGICIFAQQPMVTLHANSFDLSGSAPSSLFKYKDAHTCGVANNGAYVCRGDLHVEAI